MNHGADVRSLAQLQSLRERLTLWRAGTLKEAELLMVELHKLTTWLDDEVSAYWQQQHVLSQRHWNECREALLRCESAVRADEKRPCTDERKRLEKATQRRALCEQKVRLVREAKLAWSRQLNKLRGRVQSVADMADADIQVAVAKLSGIIDTLEAYARASSGAQRPAATSEAADLAPDEPARRADGETAASDANPE